MLSFLRPKNKVTKNFTDKYYINYTGLAKKKQGIFKTSQLIELTSLRTLTTQYSEVQIQVFNSLPTVEFFSCLMSWN